MVAELLDEDPELAWAHADAARGMAGRIAVVREAAGLAAYRSGRYAEALNELRTARRLTGSSVHLPVMADCERGLGRPERALTLATSPEARELDRAGQVEMLIVAAGARSDLGQPDAAVITLQVPQLNERVREPWLARLRAAYAEALMAVGREEDGLRWLRLAADVDDEDASGAHERLAEQDGITFLDLEEDEEGDEDLQADADIEAPPTADAPPDPPDSTDSGKDVTVDEVEDGDQEVRPAGEPAGPVAGPATDVEDGPVGRD
jgi:tetratricopeptide (TPR) repeat protein